MLCEINKSQRNKLGMIPPTEVFKIVELLELENRIKLPGAVVGGGRRGREMGSCSSMVIQFQLCWMEKL